MGSTQRQRMALSCMPYRVSSHGSGVLLQITLACRLAPPAYSLLAIVQESVHIYAILVVSPASIPEASNPCQGWAKNRFLQVPQLARASGPCATGL